MSRIFAFVVVLVFFVPRFADRGAIVVLQSASSFSLLVDTKVRWLEASSSFCRWSFFFFFFFSLFSSRGERLFSRRLFFFFFFVLVLRTIQFSFRRLQISLLLNAPLLFVVAFSLKKHHHHLYRGEKKEGRPPSYFSLLRFRSSSQKKRESLSRRRRRLEDYIMRFLSLKTIRVWCSKEKKREFLKDDDDEKTSI